MDETLILERRTHIDSLVARLREPRVRRILDPMLAGGRVSGDSLDDDLSTHFPDYPMRGQRIPIRRLLDHTSGIASYTDLPEYANLSRLALTPDSVVSFFSSHPIDFAPGARMSYNNSAYFLLGLLILLSLLCRLCWWGLLLWLLL